MNGSPTINLQVAHHQSPCLLLRKMIQGMKVMGQAEPTPAAQVHEARH